MSIIQRIKLMFAKPKSDAMSLAEITSMINFSNEYDMLLYERDVKEQQNKELEMAGIIGVHVMD